MKLMAFRRYLLRRHGKVAFVFAVFVVHYNDHPPGADFPGLPWERR